MTNLKKQTDAKIATGRQANPDFMKGVDEIIDQAKAFQQGVNAIKIGQKVPDFELPNAAGKLVSLEALLKKVLWLSHFIVVVGVHTATYNLEPYKHA